MKSELIENEKKPSSRNKGGRPEKEIKRNKLLGVKCTLVEKTTIVFKAKHSGYTVSEYLRNLGMNGKIDMRRIAMAREILQVTGSLNHMAANLNQIAKKRNQHDDLNALDRALLNQLSLSINLLAQDIKNHLK